MAKCRTTGRRRKGGSGRAVSLTLATLTLAVACGEQPLRPGDTLGTMRLSTHGEAAPRVWQYCYPAFPESPSERGTACNVPPLPRLAIGPGLRTTSDELRRSAWSATEWQLYLDGRRVDLGAFGTFDGDLEPPLAKLRGWDVLLEQPTTGSHTLRTVLVRKQSLSDGIRVTPAGRYELTVNFTFGQ
jgi:hypothetical protein